MRIGARRLAQTAISLVQFIELVLGIYDIFHLSWEMVCEIWEHGMDGDRIVFKEDGLRGADRFDFPASIKYGLLFIL